MARADRLIAAPRSAGLPTAVWVATLLAVAGHGWLLLVPWNDDRAGHPRGTVTTTGRNAAQVRVLSGADDRVDTQPVERAATDAVDMTRAQPVVATVAAPPPTSAASAPDDISVAGTAPAGIADPAEEDALFLVRSQLDRAPFSPEPIDLPYPESAPLGHYRAVMTLFIDEAGQVRRVRLDAGQLLPPLLEDAARQAFLKSRFEPGFKNGAAVRSRMRVAVEYGAEPPR